MIRAAHSKHKFRSQNVLCQDETRASLRDTLCNLRLGRSNSPKSLCENWYVVMNSPNACWLGSRYRVRQVFKKVDPLPRFGTCLMQIAIFRKLGQSFDRQSILVFRRRIETQLDCRRNLNLNHANVVLGVSGQRLPLWLEHHGRMTHVVANAEVLASDFS